MEEISLNIELREETGKNICRRLRSRGMVPAVVYGKGMDAVPAAVSEKELAGAIAGEGGRNHLIKLKGEKSLDGKLVIVSDLLLDPLKGKLLHVDLHKVNLEEKVRVSVPVSLVGTAKGVKDGGLLDFVTHTIEVECLPTQIPEHLEVDVTELKIGESIHIGQVVVPAGLKVLGDEKATVVSVLGKTKEDVIPSAETAEA